MNADTRTPTSRLPHLKSMPHLRQVVQPLANLMSVMPCGPINSFSSALLLLAIREWNDDDFDVTGGEVTRGA
jgi:hypothetical protein